MFAQNPEVLAGRRLAGDARVRLPHGRRSWAPAGGFRETPHGEGRGHAARVDVHRDAQGGGAGKPRVYRDLFHPVPNEQSRQQQPPTWSTRAPSRAWRTRDESDRDGMRVGIELRRSADPEFVRAALQPHEAAHGLGERRRLGGPRAQGSSLLDGERVSRVPERSRDPRALRAREDLRASAHRGGVPRRAGEPDAVAAIRAAPDAKRAAEALREAPWLSDAQADATLAMPLRRPPVSAISSTPRRTS